MDNNTIKKEKLYVIKHERGWKGSVFPLLDASGLPRALEGRERVLIKPNLVEALKPPITTPVGLVGAIVDYLIERTAVKEIIVGDGTGSLSYDTFYCFDELGYRGLSESSPVKLIDLNTEPLVKLSNPGLTVWKEMYLPRLALESFLISVPVLKAHTLSGVTLTMKNMFGLAPPVHYQQGGHWKKSAFHARIHESVFEVNSYRKADFTILDATVGMRDAHLWGPTLDPPPGILVAGADPVAIDAYGTAILGRDVCSIPHINMAHGVLGFTEPSSVEEI